MDIEARAEYPADPSSVFALLTNRDFLEQVCQQTHAREQQISVDGGAVMINRTLPAPDQARPFTGETLTVIEEVSWSEAAADGSRTGSVSMTVPGQPVTFRGTYQLADMGGRTSMTLSGNLTVNVPLMGKKLEQAAEPAVLQAFRAQEELGADWL